MLTSSPPKKDVRPISAMGHADDKLDALKFISELGRSLLITVHPKKVASRVAEAVRSAVETDVCAFVAELENIGLISCAFNAEGELDTGFLRRERLDKWLAFMPPQIAYAEQEESEFLVNGDHKFEYISPLHINGEIRGAIVIGFRALLLSR